MDTWHKNYCQHWMLNQPGSPCMLLLRFGWSSSQRGTASRQLRLGRKKSLENKPRTLSGPAGRNSLLGTGYTQTNPTCLSCY